MSEMERMRNYINDEIWDKKGVTFAKNEFMKLYYKKYNVSNIEDKVSILYGLICAEACIKECKESLYIHSEQLKIDMENDNTYIKIHKRQYAKLLAYYRDSHINELTDDEIIEINNKCYDAFKKYNDPTSLNYLDMLISKFNIYLFNKDYNAILDLIKIALLHKENNIKQYNITLISFSLDIKRVFGQEKYEYVEKLIA